jgi:hypothetical protein
MASRYDKRRIFNNGRLIYYDYIIDRGAPGFIRQYVSPLFHQISQGDYNNLSVAEELWTMGDSLSKLAGKYYGSGTYWWVIAYFNNKPTDAHFKVGDTVYVPTSLTDALATIGK